MQTEIFVGLLKNIEILLILVVLYQLNIYFGSHFGRFKSLIAGILIGLIGVLVMTYPFVFQSGLVFDTRSILIASVALFFSTPVLFISSFIMILYRIYMGGIGMITGISVIVITTIIGILWRKSAFDSNNIPKWVNIYLYGILVHGAMLLTMFILPYPLATETVHSLGIPILILYPLATLTISALMLIQRNHDRAFGMVRDAQQKYSSLFNNQHTVMLVIDPHSLHIVDANPAAISFYGWPKEVLLLKKISEINVLTDDQIKVEMEKVKERKKTSLLFKHRKANGEVVDVEVYSGPISINNKQLLYSIIIDISLRVKAEEEMKRNMDLFRTVVENEPDAIFIQLERRFAYLNPAALKLFKAKDETEIMGMRILERVHSDYRDEVQHIMAQLNEQRVPTQISQRIYLTMENEPIHVESFAVPILFFGQKGAMIIARDISVQLDTLSALQKSETNFRAVVKNMPMPIFILQKGKFAFLNPAARKFFGANEEDLCGMDLSQFVLQKDVDEVNEHLRKVCEESVDLPLHQHYFVQINGNLVLAEVGAVNINYDGKNSALVYVRDLTKELELEKKKADWEMQIQQKQRLESIGVLAGGVAHEINNPINGIMNYAQLMIEESQGNDSIEDYGHQIIKESHRISDIVKSLLQFSRHEKHTHSYTSMYDIIDNTMSLIKVIFKKEQIELRINMEENLPDIKCRSQQIQQVFMNLMTNAKDALNEKYPEYDANKVIEVDVWSKYADDRHWVCLSVKDYGLGVSDEVKSRIFEPFFSTKPKDKGTGLGLAISFGIVEDHQGKILIDSVMNEYTLFTVVLPVENSWHHIEEEQS